MVCCWLQTIDNQQFMCFWLFHDRTVSISLSNNHLHEISFFITCSVDIFLTITKSKIMDYYNSLLIIPAPLSTLSNHQQTVGTSRWSYGASSSTSILQSRNRGILLPSEVRFSAAVFSLHHSLSRFSVCSIILNKTVMNTTSWSNSSPTFLYHLHPSMCTILPGLTWAMREELRRTDVLVGTYS